MKRSSFNKKRIIHIYVIIFILTIIGIVTAALMFKYHVEGEQNLPFKLKKINVISTAESDLKQDEQGTWHAGILQKNDIYFVIEKNSNYKKDEAIKRISFENFKVVKSNEEMVVDFYKPTISVGTYNYSDEYKIEGSLELLGGMSTNMEMLQINNQGGTIGFSVAADNIGEYVFKENEKLPSDGRLFAKAGIEKENINFSISFDLIIETESSHRFKSNITVDLPTGNILEDGVGTLEDTEMKEIIFKRF